MPYFFKQKQKPAIFGSGSSKKGLDPQVKWVRAIPHQDHQVVKSVQSCGTILVGHLYHQTT
jgi:hypothetical protein